MATSVFRIARQFNVIHALHTNSTSVNSLRFNSIVKDIFEMINELIVVTRFRLAKFEVVNQKKITIVKKLVVSLILGVCCIFP